MKATKAGIVVGQAMDNYTDGAVGQITAYVKAGSYSGSAIASIYPGISVDAAGSSDGLAVNETSVDESSQILFALLAAKDSAVSNQAVSEITTDRLTAGLEVISPKVTASDIAAEHVISLPGLDIQMQLDPNNQFTIGGKNASTSGLISFDANGNATLSGTLTAKRIHADQIDGLPAMIASILQQQIGTSSAEQAVLSASDSSTLTSLLETAPLINMASSSSTFDPGVFSTGGVATMSGDLRVTGNGLFEGVLHVADTLMTQNFIVSGLSDFFGTVVFHNDVSFVGRPTFNQDTAGTAIIKQGDTQVSVTFTTPYDTTPIVTANMSLNQTDTTSSADAANTIFASDYRYVIVNRNEKGFTIVLNTPAKGDLPFSWVALSVKDQLQDIQSIGPTPISGLPASTNTLTASSSGGEEVSDQ